MYEIPTVFHLLIKTRQMKTSPLKSVAMKTNAVATSYFSAYPLKAIKSIVKEDEQNSGHSVKLMGRLRILPMINPYGEKKCSINNIKFPANIESGEPGWFNHYE
ncbi:MAG: hypothetical protein C4308_01405 [Chitinophagaceae bacterium]